MPIAVTCQCGKALNVPESFAGKQGKCPACGTVLNIPAVSSPAIAPPPQIMAPPPLQYATPGNVGSGPIAPPPAEVIPIPHGPSPKYANVSAPPCFVVISGEGAEVQTDFDLTRVMQGLVDGLAAKMKKRYSIVVGPATM